MNDLAEVESLARVAGWLFENGWAESNAGNMSVRINPEEKLSQKGPYAEFPMKHSFPNLGGTRLLITGTMRRMRDVPSDPHSNLGLIEILDGGNSYRCLWGCGMVTSEFPAHLAIHSMCIAERREMKAVLHTHPPHLIAMSHLREMQGRLDINRTLRRIHPEIFILMPKGTSMLAYRIPGGVGLGEATCDALKKRDTVLWARHGIVSIAPDFDV